MCYSAMAEQDYKKYGIKKGDMVDVARFRELIHRRTMGENIYITKAMEANFTLRAQSPEEKEIGKEILEYRKVQVTEEEKKLFGFKKRLGDAERKLKEKLTKTYQKEKEVCERQIDRTKTKLEKLKTDELTEGDSRIFPMGWAPMMILKDGHRVIVPARYHLRPQGQKPEFDYKYDGNYNARRENLEKVPWWRNIFGKNHGIMVIHKFFENVPKSKFEKRKLKAGEKDENVVLEFEPANGSPMYVAVIYDTWPNSKNPEFYSAAAITMDPPPEIAETGHERCIVPIPEELVDAWLQGGKPLLEYYDILDRRVMPGYRHRIAA
jgi:putative SOS response-associated peptidase YedK